MEFLRDFKQITKNDVALAGGKGASLGELTQAGIPVPPGFVILSTAFDKFIIETDLNIEIEAILHGVNLKEIHTLENAAEKIQALILGKEIPLELDTEIRLAFQELNFPYVAVRSSATAEDSASAAWAGQLESYLNTTEENLLENVKKCWASLFTPRAIFYRFEKDLHKQKISVAVVVQKMVQSEKSGIAFSVHPVTEDRNQMIIEAGYGLGEAIVSGQITPDSYVVEKIPCQIIDKNIIIQTKGLYRAKDGGNEWRDISLELAEKSVLGDEEILKLSELVLIIENHYGFPSDIEWACENGEFYIVQSRPITTLKNINNVLDENWTKVWTTEYSLFSVLLFGRGYTEVCWRELGVGFSNIIFIIEGPLATLYRLDKEQKEFAQKLAYRMLFEEKFRYKSIKLLSDIQAEFEEFFEMPEQEVLTPQKWSRFLEIHSLYIPYYIGVLWAPNELERFDVPQKLREIVFTICEDARKKSEQIYPSLEKFLQRLFKFIALKEKRDEHFLRAILPDELTNYVNGKYLPQEVTLKSRYDYSIIWTTKENNKILLGIEARKIIEKISKINTDGVNEIRGTVANGGLIMGKVKVMFMEQDMDKIKEGDVIVTTMTRPEWAAAMKLASAYVTDAGGVLCHAAIIAREMNKPCIIGTKIATKVLKDGDLVEVDANNGVVRILN